MVAVSGDDFVFCSVDGLVFRGSDGGDGMSVWPDKLMIRDTGIYEDCGRRIHTTAGSGYEKVEYTRTATIPDPAAIARAALEKAAAAAYVVCAETRHVTLGSKAEAAILALASNPAALAEIVKGVKK
jgi:hypothetical protein